MKIGKKISSDSKKKIDGWVIKYPTESRQSLVMHALRVVQNENDNYLTTENIISIANYLDMSQISVMEVATFYENYNHQPVGKHQIRICHNISCMLNGSDSLIEYLQDKIKNNNEISLKKVECLGACVGSPMMQIADKYYENLTEGKIDEILESL